MLTQDDLQLKDKDELIKIISSTQLALQASDVLQQENINKITSQQTQIEQLREYIRLLKHEKFCARTERYVDNDAQGRLFDEAELPANVTEIEAEEADIMIPAHTRKKGGKKPLPKDVPREQRIYDLLESEKHCACGSALTCIGDERSEQLDIIPAKITVIEHIQKKYACKRCEETITTAAKAKQPIPQSIAAPGLLAHVLTSKFQFHLPLYRQEIMLQQIGADISRATLSLWVIRCGELLQPLVNLMQDEILSYDVAYADESTVQVLKEKNKTAQSTSYMWCFGGGPPERFCYVYQYHPGRSYAVAESFFANYCGYLHCDGYQAYDALAAKNSAIKQVGCWYHARRKFTDVTKLSKKSGYADWVLKQIQRLAKIEKKIIAEQMSPDDTKAYRQQHAPQILDKIKAKLHESQTKASASGTLSKAINYLTNQWPKLQVYLEDGRLDISNNRMERAFKAFATGRKNWLFANSTNGASAAAIIFSLIETCKAHDVNPYDWLRDTLTKIPAAQNLEDYEALLPFHFKQTQK